MHKSLPEYGFARSKVEREKERGGERIVRWHWLERKTEADTGEEWRKQRTEIPGDKECSSEKERKGGCVCAKHKRRQRQIGTELLF